MTPLNEMGAREAARRLAAREISAEQMARACLERIAAREAVVGAWIHLDPDAVLAQARRLDAGPVRGPLHGLPVAVKDLIDTMDMPTGYGSPIYAGHRPRTDAACVALARAAGAVILGKTVTTEFAWFHPGKTANPRNPGRTPGGSSSGSAAAVADCMVPIAFGTQTAGSTVRPASYCGIVGYKPTFGTIPRTGAKPLADSLDTIGVLARGAADAGFLAGTLSGRAILGAPCDGAPRIGLCRTHEWKHALPESAAALERAARLASGAGAKVAERALPGAYAGLLQAQLDVMDYEAYGALAGERLEHPEKLSAKLQQMLANAGKVNDSRYDAARALAARCRAMQDEAFGDAEVLMTPSAPGEAPRGLGATGDPVFCRVWTLLGNPSINVPGATGPNGLPIGVQLVGRIGEDARLVAAAEWLQEVLR
jgi:amidase